MAGTAILSNVEFSQPEPFILTLAASMVGVLVSSEVPVDVGVTWLAFPPVPAVDCTSVRFRHWDGKLFPVTCGADLDTAPQATLAIVLEDNIFAAEEWLMEALRKALGDDSLTQRYTYP
jgi:hypothetical protein